MERDLSWERPSVEVKGQTVWHNQKRWHVKRNGHPTTAGNSWGWIEGPDTEIQWSNDGEQFAEADAQRVAQEHNDWLAAQVPHELNILDAVQVAEGFEREAARLRSLLADAEAAATMAQGKVREAVEAAAAQHDAAIAKALRAAASELLTGVAVPAHDAKPYQVMEFLAEHLESIANDYGGPRS